MRAAVAAPPTLLPRRSTDASAPPASTQVYCNALALYEDATEQRHRGAAPAKARGRAPTVPAASVPAPSVPAPSVPAPSVPAPSPRVGAEVGMGLSASVAMLNHRCDPNVDWGLDASGGRARTSGPLPAPSTPWHGPSSRRRRTPRRAPGGLGPLEPLVTPKRRGDPAGAPRHLPSPRGLELPASLMVADPTPSLSFQAASWSVRCGPSAPARSCASRTSRRVCPPPSVRRTCSRTSGSSAAALAVQRNDGAKILY